MIYNNKMLFISIFALSFSPLVYSSDSDSLSTKDIESSFVKDPETGELVLLPETESALEEKSDSKVAPSLSSPYFNASFGIEAGFVDGADEGFLTLHRTSLSAHYDYLGFEIAYTGTINEYDDTFFNDQLQASSQTQIDSESLAGYFVISPDNQSGLNWRIKGGVSKTNITIDSTIRQNGDSSSATRSFTDTGFSLGGSVGYRWYSGLGLSLDGHYLSEDLLSAGLSVDYSFSLNN